jgi:endonuclease/exonuclease/phosphatase family metal-dependent hydrolase
MNILSWNLKQFNFNPGKSLEEQQLRMIQVASFIDGVRPDVAAIMEIRPGTASGSINQMMDDSQGVLAIEQVMSYLEVPLQVTVSGINALRQATAGELYAILYNPKTVELLNDFNVVYHDSSSQSSSFTNRAPGFAVFKHRATQYVFCVMVFHAPKPSDMSVAQIQILPKLAASFLDNVILCGDFNMDTVSVANALGKGFSTAEAGKGTSLRVKPDGQDNAFDAIFYQTQSHLQCINHGVINPIEIAVEASGGTDLSKQEISATKRYTSDHAGVWAEFSFV